MAWCGTLGILSPGTGSIPAPLGVQDPEIDVRERHGGNVGTAPRRPREYLPAALGGRIEAARRRRWRAQAQLIVTQRRQHGALREIRRLFDGSQHRTENEPACIGHGHVGVPVTDRASPV
jgi:hypothetical protein